MLQEMLLKARATEESPVSSWYANKIKNKMKSKVVKVVILCLLPVKQNLW
jgi:hypothetical protein